MEEIKIEELDLYELLEIDISSSIPDIKKAYRKKALQCHPDKNPDNPNAGREFHRLSKILEILIDESARKAYDRVLKGRKEAALRHQELDSKRRKLKEDLESREKSASNTAKQKSAAELLKAEIERLRKEGSKQVEEELENIQKELRKQHLSHKDHASSWDSSKHRIKIKWTAEKGDSTNGGYTQEMLHRFLSKYGNITALVLSAKKRGSALVEFETRSAAVMAVDMESGLSTNPLKLEWVDGPPSSKTQSSLVKPSDYESLVLTKMRQAEERRKLIEQLKLEDENS